MEQASDKTYLISATRGEAGRIKGQNLQDDGNKTTSEIRMSEFIQSCRILSVDKIEFLDLPDSNANNWNVDEAISKLKSILLEIGPSVIVTFNKDGGNNHPDHKEIHRVSVRAFEEIKNGDYRLFFITKLPKDYIARRNLLTLPTQIIDKVTVDDSYVSKIIQLSEDELSIKKKIVESYQSQFPDENGLFYKMPYQILENIAQIECFDEFNKKNNKIVEVVSML